MVCEGLVDNWTPMRCDIGCWMAAFSLPECFVPRVWEGARHCCRLQERRKEERWAEPLIFQFSILRNDIQNVQHTWLLSSVHVSSCIDMNTQSMQISMENMHTWVLEYAANIPRNKLPDLNWCGRFWFTSMNKCIFYRAAGWNTRWCQQQQQQVQHISTCRARVINDTAGTWEVIQNKMLNVHQLEEQTKNKPKKEVRSAEGLPCWTCCYGSSVWRVAASN